MSNTCRKKCFVVRYEMMLYFIYTTTITKCDKFSSGKKQRGNSLSSLCRFSAFWFPRFFVVGESSHQKSHSDVRIPLSGAIVALWA